MIDEVKDYITNKFTYIHFKEGKDSNNLLVAFSHVGYPAGKFGMSNVLNGIDCNILYVNCAENSWYQAGVDEFCDSIEKTADLIKSVASYTNAKNIFTVGMSMGGYAAVLFGILCEARHVLAFTPELFIGLKWTRSYYLNNLRKYSKDYTSLQKLIRENLKTKVNFIYGIYDLTDLSLIWNNECLFLNKNLYNVSFFKDAHKLPTAFNIYFLCKSIIYEGEVNGLLKSHNSYISYEPNFSDSVSYHNMARLKCDGNSDEFFNVAKNFTKEDKFWIFYFIGEEYKRINRIDEAIVEYEKSIAQDGDFFGSRFARAECLDLQNKFEKSQEEWAKIMEMKPDAIQFIRRRAMSLFNLGKLSDAVEEFEKIIAIKKDDQSALDMLKKLKSE